MTILFQSRMGSVAKLTDPEGVLCQLSSYTVDPGIAYETHNVIVTRVAISQQANLQFLHTVGRYVYVYSFGDRMGTLGLSGLAFKCPCTPTVSVKPGNRGKPVIGKAFQQHGMGNMLQYYSLNRASRKSSPITLTIGGQVFLGFLVGITGDVVDPSAGLMQWDLSLSTLPEN